MRYERMLGIADRHNKLVELIREGDHSSFDLAAKLGVSEQTIYRDIAFLRQNGLRIESEKCAAAWAYRICAETLEVPTTKGAKTK
jgi:predicted DNA-binding transcriptional regulator YafY